MRRFEDNPAAKELYEVNAAAVRRFLLSRCGSPETADDLTAVTFEQALVHFERGRGHEVTTAWLMTVARRRLIDHWRRAERDRDRAGTHVDPECSASEGLLDPEVVDAMKRIKPSHSRSLYLKYIADLSTTDVAKDMQLSYRAAESVLRRARVALREQLDLDDGDGLRLAV